MTDPTSDSESNGESQTARPGMPRWVKVSAAVVVVMVLVLIVVMALAGGEHGPGLHTGAINGAGRLPSPAVGSQ